MANSVIPDETTRLDLHCFHRNQCCSAGLKGLSLRECPSFRIYCFDAGNNISDQVPVLVRNYHYAIISYVMF